MTSGFTKDKNAVYFAGEPLPNSDPGTFRIVGNSYLKLEYFPDYFAFDKNQLYADGSSREGVQIWKNIDIESLEFFPEPFNSCFFADRYHFFYFNTYVIEYVTLNEIGSMAGYIAELRRRKPNADAWWNKDKQYYESLKPAGGNFYANDKKLFYFFDKKSQYSYPYYFGFGDKKDDSYFSILPNVSPNDFKALNEYYGIANKKVYHVNRPIEADGESFEVIQGHFAKDKSGVFYNGYRAKGEMDIDSFEVFEYFGTNAVSGYFAKDINKLFSTQYHSRIGKYEGYSELLVALKDSDPKSFSKINGIWARDNNNVYCYGTIWKDIDAKTFRFLFTDSEFDRRSYVVDKNYLYDANGRAVKKNIDGASFQMLSQYWGKDKNSVFNFKTGKIVKGLDPETFRAIGNNGQAEDENYIYKLTYNDTVLGHNELKKIKKK